MSLTPTTPNLQNQSRAEIVKSLWKQEGSGWAKAGIVVAGVLVVGAVVKFLDPIMETVANLSENLLMAGVYLGIFALITTPIWEPHMRALCLQKYLMLVHNLLKSEVEKDPIGAIRVNVRKISDRLVDFMIAIKQLAGSKAGIQNDIIANQKDIDNKTGLARTAEKERDRLQAQCDHLTAQGASEDDINEMKLQIQQLDLRATNAWAEAGDLQNGQTELQDQLKVTSNFYFNLSQIGNVLDATVKKQTASADNYEKRRKRFQTSQVAIDRARGIITPDTQEAEINDIAINKLNEEVANTMGDMEDLQHLTSTMILDAKLQTGANASAAQQKFNEIAARIQKKPSAPASLTSGAPQGFLDAKMNASGQYEVPSTSYADVFKDKK
jgi:hypothetical protein